MTDRVLSPQHLNAFRENLIREEKSAATVEKYLRDARTFLAYSTGATITKEHTVAFKQSLQEQGYAICSINSMLASINKLMDFMGCPACKEKSYRQKVWEIGGSGENRKA